MGSQSEISTKYYNTREDTIKDCMDNPCRGIAGTSSNIKYLRITPRNRATKIETTPYTRIIGEGLNPPNDQHFYPHPPHDQTLDCSTHQQLPPVSSAWHHHQQQSFQSPQTWYHEWSPSLFWPLPLSTRQVRKVDSLETSKVCLLW